MCRDRVCQRLFTKSVAVQVVSHELCAAAMDPWMAAVGYGSIDAGFLCAGAAGKDACYGDSGGPLTSDSGDQAVLIGAVSTGDGCAKVRILRDLQTRVEPPISIPWSNTPPFHICHFSRTPTECTRGYPSTAGGWTPR